MFKKYKFINYKKTQLGGLNFSKDTKQCFKW